MIHVGARLSVRRLPLSCLLVQESASCFPAKYDIYFHLLTEHPELDVEPIVVEPCQGHEGLYVIRNGKHRYAASIMAGRSDLLSIIVENEDDD